MKLSFLSLKIDTGSYHSFIERICKMALTANSNYVCIANVHMLVEAYNSSVFAGLVNDASLVTPDGMPLCVGLNKLYGTRQDRVAGMTLLPDLLQAAEIKKIPVFFYGGKQTLIDKVSQVISIKFPHLQISGTYCPPYRKLTLAEEVEVIDLVNSSGARIVFVALGCPKQETWMAGMKNRINACMIGIGGALPVLAGIQKRAPVWMQKYSLEWLFRLYQEPKRLLRRYTITNSIFIWLFIKKWASQGFKPQPPVLQMPACTSMEQESIKSKIICNEEMLEA